MIRSTSSGRTVRIPVRVRKEPEFYMVPGFLSAEDIEKSPQTVNIVACDFPDGPSVSGELGVVANVVNHPLLG